MLKWITVDAYRNVLIQTSVFFFKIRYSSTLYMKGLAVFFPMFLFDLLENIRKPKVFRCFQGVKKKHCEEKGNVTLFIPNSDIVWLKYCRLNFY